MTDILPLIWQLRAIQPQMPPDTASGVSRASLLPLSHPIQYE
jgi:hypothetical protein